MPHPIASLLVLAVILFPLQTATGAEQSVAERVKSIVAEHLAVDKAKITLQSDLKRDLKVDCLDVLELVMAFEEHFGKEIPDQVFAGLATVGEAVTLIQSGKMPTPKSPPACPPPDRSGKK